MGMSNRAKRKKRQELNKRNFGKSIYGFNPHGEKKKHKEGK